MNSNKSVKQKFKTIIDFTVLLVGALHCKIVVHLLLQNSLMYRLSISISANIQCDSLYFVLF